VAKVCIFSLPHCPFSTCHHHRREATPAQAAHGLYHIVVTVRFSDLENLQLRDAMEGLDSAVRFGGVSGGAVLRITADSNYSLAGIVYEGLGPADLTGSVYTQKRHLIS
jgi:hypothetical protein